MDPVTWQIRYLGQAEGQIVVYKGQVRRKKRVEPPYARGGGGGDIAASKHVVENTPISVKENGRIILKPPSVPDFGVYIYAKKVEEWEV